MKKQSPVFCEAGKKLKFTGIFIPAGVLDIKNISMVEKLIISDIGYLNNYRVSNAQMAKKFGVSRRTIINGINRLKSPKIGFIVDTGHDNYHRCLKLNGEISALFKNSKGAKTAPPEQPKRFLKPTAEEVTEYARSIDFELDGHLFIDSYDSKGWMVGKSKMQDWKATVRTWKKRQDNGNSSKNRQCRETVGAFVR